MANIPKEILDIAHKLNEAKFDVYLVGGSLRDILLDNEPKDWDLTTNAKPDQIQKIFPDSVYENDFGTVAIKATHGSARIKNRIDTENNQSKSEYDQCKSVNLVEVTTFRKDIGYSDKRHPDKIVFAKTIEEDLARRDFTVNAMALKIQNDNAKFKIIDLFEGEEDLKNKIIRAVGNPEERFNEDALRMMRAVRFAAQLGFDIETKTQNAIKRDSSLLRHIADERIRDELQKIIMSNQAAWGIQMLYSLGLLKFVLPEIMEGIGVSQNKHHIYTVWEHNLRALNYAVSKNYSFEIRLAALLHDVGKPKTKNGEGPDSTFYAHEIVGAKMAKKALERLKFPKDTVDYVTHLVRYHLFYYNVGEVSPAGVRRFISRVGEEYIDDLIKIREADRIGSGVPKAFPYKLRHLLFMIEKVKHDPISPKSLKIDGNDLMKLLNMKPSPRVGHILNILLNEVIDDPKRNERGYLDKRAIEINNMSDTELVNLRNKAEKAKEEFEGGIEQEMKKRHKV